MSGFGYSDWSYDPFEKMVIFPPDPLVEGGEGERREEWGEVSGFYINRLINSKSPKTLSTQQPTKMMGGRRRTAGRRVGIRGGNGL